MAKSKHRKKAKKRVTAAKKRASVSIGAPVDYAKMFMPANGSTIVGASVSANLKRG